MFKSLFLKKCELCHKKIPKGKEHFALVKTPSYTTLLNRPFCSKAHIKKYKTCVLGTPRRDYCPSCPI